MGAMADALSTLGASFITFFSIVNPIGSALIFDRAVVDLSRLRGGVWRGTSRCCRV